MIIPYFGLAVHAILKYLQNGGDPATIRKQNFYDDILHIGWDQERPLSKNFLYNQKEKECIYRCWEYISLIQKGARSLEYEPLMDNGRRPDIVAKGKSNTSVIEIKTFSHIFTEEIMNKRFRGMYNQIEVPAQILQRKVTNGSKVTGHALIFENKSDPDNLTFYWQQFEPFICGSEHDDYHQPDFMKQFDTNWPYLKR